MPLSNSPSTHLHVAVGVICSGQGEILIAKRHESTHQGGLWEFPGGKLEPGETALEALRRELWEELAIMVQQAAPLIQIHHDYGDKPVLLDVWKVESFRGVPAGQQNQPLRWVATKELAQYEFPAANRPIVAAARLPDDYPIIVGNRGDETALFDRIERLSGQAHTLAQWRVWPDEGGDYLALTRRAVDYARARGLELLLNADPSLAGLTGAAGVHLNRWRLQALRHRPLSAELWVAAACHDEAEIRRAERLGADFIVLSPVLPTPSHPDATPLGWDQFGALASQAKLPVYALGGMMPQHKTQAKQCGAQGVSGIRGFG